MSYPIFELGATPDNFDMRALPYNEEAYFINPNLSEWHGNGETDVEIPVLLDEFFESFPFWDSSIIAYEDDTFVKLYKQEMVDALIPLVNNSANKVMREVKGVSDHFLRSSELDAPAAVGNINKVMAESAYKTFPCQPGIYVAESGSTAGFSLVEILNILSEMEDYVYLSNTILRIK